MANRKTAKKHALRRLKSRQGVKSISTAEALVDEVLENGTQVRNLPQDHPVSIAYAHKSNTWRKRAWYYKEFIYVFSDDKVLITTYPTRKEGIQHND